MLRAPAAHLLSDEAFDELLLQVERCHQRAPFALVVDVPRFVVPPAARRRRIADHILRQQRNGPHQLIALAVVTPAVTLASGYFRVMDWLAPSPQPQAVFARVDDAVLWASRCCLGDQPQPAQQPW